MSIKPKAKKQEKSIKIDHAEKMNRKGDDLDKNRKYKTAIERCQKAVELKPSKVEYIIKLARAYRDDEKFAEALQLIDEALDKFPQKKGQKDLKIELANIHSSWADKLRKKYDYANALKHYEISYNINKAYKLYYSSFILSDIGHMYEALGKEHKALVCFEKASSIMRSYYNRPGEIKNLNNIGRVYYALGQKQKALEYYEKALSISRAIGYRYGEAEPLNNIGQLYSDLGQKYKALEYFEKSLQLNRASGERKGEAATLNNIGLVYSDLGQKQEALEYYEKALPIRRAMGDQVGEAITLNNIGLVYSDIDQKQKALEYYEIALKIMHTAGNQQREAAIRQNIGAVYKALGQKQKALEYYEKALTIQQAVSDKVREATTLNSIGLVYYDLGQKKKALEYFEKALLIKRVVGDRLGEAITLTNIGGVYEAYGQKQKAMEYYEKALPICQSMSSRSIEAAILNRIGGLYFALGQKQKALEYFEKALPINRTIGDRFGEAQTLNNIGGVYTVLGEKQKALESFERALPILRIVSHIEGEATCLQNLIFLWGSLKKIRLSIFYGKQSVNLYQKLRANISGLEKKLQRSYLESKQHTYRILANLLITEGRLSEAQQVLDMKKVNEFRDFVRRDTSYTELPSLQVNLTKFEKQWLEKYNTVMDELSSISNEYHILKFKKNKTDAEKKRMGELEPELQKATKTYEDFLAQLKEAFDKYEKDIKAGKIDPETLAKKASELQETLKYLDEKEGEKHAAIHYLVHEGSISVIITTPSHQLKKQAEINEKAFNQLIMNYRNFIMKSPKTTRDARPVDTSTANEIEKNPYEKKLYDIIFKPVDEKLRKYGATNLMVSLDGVLRYIPLAALWDGKNYLVQRYRIAILTPSSLKNIKDEPVKKKKILGFGASRGGQGLKRLPNVMGEIKAVVKDKEKGYNGLIEGKAFLDKDFTKEAMVNELKQKHYPLVHIASHFKFSPGDETKNFLLLGDGSALKLSEIRRMGNLFDSVNLLVLSACQTGVGGNGEEIDGFGELAQQSGAKSVVASLWPVADKSTKYLMVNFYRILKQGKVTSKIEALRQAQLQLAGLEDLLGKNKSTINQAVRKKTGYYHPYYWGPFILMGNWR